MKGSLIVLCLVLAGIGFGAPNHAALATGREPDTGPVQATERVRVPILMYHHLTTLSWTASFLRRELTVTPAFFDEQVAYLAAHDYHTITFSALIAHFKLRQPLPANPIILTFDDAWRDDYSVAYPALKQYSMVGTFFIPSRYVGNAATTLTWAQVEEMSAGGMEIGDHTIDHPNLIWLSDGMVRAELEVSKEVLESHIHKPVRAFAYPYGAYSARVISLVKEAGFEAAATCNSGEYQTADELSTLHRIEIPYWDDLALFAARLAQP